MNLTQHDIHKLHTVIWIILCQVLQKSRLIWLEVQFVHEMTEGPP